MFGSESPRIQSFFSKEITSLGLNSLFLDRIYTHDNPYWCAQKSPSKMLQIEDDDEAITMTSRRKKLYGLATIFKRHHDLALLFYSSFL